MRVKSHLQNQFQVCLKYDHMLSIQCLIVFYGNVFKHYATQIPEIIELKLLSLL